MDMGDKEKGRKDKASKEKLGPIDQDFVRRNASKITDKDIEKVVEKSSEIKEKFNPKGTLRRFIEDGQLMLSIVKDYCAGNYKKIPFLAIGAIVFSLLYVLNPLDLIPDVLPVIGQIDDATVVSICLLMVEQELLTYKKWKNEG